MFNINGADNSDSAYDIVVGRLSIFDLKATSVEVIALDPEIAV